MRLSLNGVRVWLSGDFHDGHYNIINYCNRPFKDVHEMRETILNNFNSVVESDDIVFFLGDIGMNEQIADEILGKMNGKIHFILGNHDKSCMQAIKKHSETVSDLIDAEIDGQPITMCHYAMRVWHKSHFDAPQIYAHSHGRLPPIGKQWDVGVDNNGFKPLSYNDLKHIMESRPHNDNYIPEDKRNR